MSLEVTSLIAGLLTLMMVPLSVQVSMRRVKLQTVFGDADDELLRRRIRAHGNFVEYVPTSLIALGLIEWNGAPHWLVWTVGVAVLGARVVHAYGMLYTRTTVFRGIAMLLQHAAFLAAGAWLVLWFSA
ncbi:MAG TPA: MAPEG family protein [Gammaproteobacteria bacterium]